MNVSRIAIYAAIGILLLCSFEATASEDDCVVRTGAQRASWIAGVQRRIHNHDPAHAAQMSKAVSEIINGEIDALKGDLASGLDPNSVLKTGAKSSSDMSLLTLAAAACQRGVAEQLLAAGASVNGAEDSIPLVTAAASGATSLVTLFIQRGASIDKADWSGHTALEDAVRQHQINTVKLLLSHGSNPNRMAGGGGTIFDIVAHSSDPADQAISKELHAYGAAAALTTGAQ